MDKLLAYIKDLVVAVSGLSVIGFAALVVIFAIVVVLSHHGGK
ncbi:MAG: hypothetical protein AB1805_12225 [Nitrospirota bacterium]